MLASFARLLGGHLRDQDLACRFGGEEFLLLVSNIDGAQIEALTQRLRSQWQSTDVGAGEDSLSATVSIGYTLIAPNEQAPLHTLVERADQALYRAKENGRNRVEAWAPGVVESS
mgnify:FL=1